MVCESCGEHKKTTAKDFTKAVIEINNPEVLTLFHKVVIPLSMGDEESVPAAIGKYRNVLLVYEANNHAYLYSSDGIPTLLTSDVAKELEERVDTLSQDLSKEVLDRKDADDLLQQAINTKANTADLASVATSGSYADLSNKPTIGDGTLTIQKNSTSVGTFTANATANSTIDITVPTKTSDLTNDGADNTSTYVEADELSTVATTGAYSDLTGTPTIDTTLSTSSSNAVTNAAISGALDEVVMTDFGVNANPSTTTVQLDGAKKNLYSDATTTKNVALPVASTTQAGVMNSATFDAVTDNTNNLNAIMNGAVAVTGLSASPSQSDLTTAWQTETGLTTLINRASIYDVTNDKVWTYYTNDTTWHAASNTTQVTVNTFTNSSEGTIKGSTNTGQIFAENDGTGSVNGWDSLSSAVSDNSSNITALQGAVAAIPTVNNATLTIQNNGTNVATFTANSATNTTANIVSPVNVGSVSAGGVAQLTDSSSSNIYPIAGGMANDSITTAMLQNEAVTAAKFAEYAVNEAIFTENNLLPTGTDIPGAWWGALNHDGYYCTYYNQSSFTNQPTTYGFLETIIKGQNLAQRWTTLASGATFFRTGNISAGWYGSSSPTDYTKGTFKRFLDTRNYYNYTVPFVKEGTGIPENSNLNTLAFCQPGMYYARTNERAATLTNCPTGQAFRMEVYNITDDATTITSDMTYKYLVRKVVNIEGEEFVQYVRVTSLNNWNYSLWRKTLAGINSGTITARSGTTLGGNTFVKNRGGIINWQVQFTNTSDLNAGANYDIATMPSGYRPTITSVGYGAHSDGRPMYVRVLADGTIRVTPYVKLNAGGTKYIGGTYFQY